MLSRVGVAAALVLACAGGLAACVGDDTAASPGSEGTQGGSGPPPSSYEDVSAPAFDATYPGPDASDAGGDASPDATFDAPADAPFDANLEATADVG